MMNGYTYSDLLGRSGKPLSVKVDGKPRVFHGEPAQPARLRINGTDAAPTTVVHAGDHVDFTPAVPGADWPPVRRGAGTAAPHPVPYHQWRRCPSGGPRSGRGREL